MPATRSTTLLPGLLDRLADYRRLRQAVTQGKSPLALSGLAAVHRTHFAAALRQDTKRPLVLVCPDDAEARRAAGDLGAFLGEEVLVVLIAVNPSNRRAVGEHGQRSGGE